MPCYLSETLKASISCNGEHWAGRGCKYWDCKPAHVENGERSSREVASLVPLAIPCSQIQPRCVLENNTAAGWSLTAVVLQEEQSRDTSTDAPLCVQLFGRRSASQHRAGRGFCRAEDSERIQQQPPTPGTLSCPAGADQALAAQRLQ